MNSIHVPSEQFLNLIPRIDGLGYVCKDAVDPICIECLQFIASSPGPVLEIGAGYGAFTSKILRARNTIPLVVNDSDGRHLEIIKSQLSHSLNRITFIPGTFTDLKGLLEKNSIGTIIVHGVFQFMDGYKIREAFEIVANLLMPGGRVFIISDSPFNKLLEDNWLPKYLRNIESSSNEQKQSDLWPGYFENFESSSPLAQNYPKSLHYLDVNVLQREASRIGLSIDSVRYLNRYEYPDLLRLDGRESVGLIVSKPQFHVLPKALNYDPKGHALVLGCRGLAGTHLTKYLVKNGWRVSGTTVRNDHIMDNISVMGGVDLCDYASTTHAFQHLNDITHVFYCSWKKCDNEEIESAENLLMLQNAVRVIESVSSATLRRFILLHGTRWYGVHLGPSKCVYNTPFEEADERPVKHLFYYVQQDWIADYQKNKFWTWSTVRPFTLIGFSNNRLMNLVTGIAVYASVLKKMGLPLIFPGTYTSYTTLVEATSVDLLARLMEWTAVSPNAKNEPFNCVNGDFFRWESFWPVIADWFGMDFELPTNPRRSVMELMEGKESVWEELVKEHGLKKYGLFDLLSVQFVDNVLTREYDSITSMTKARIAGFHYILDSKEAYLNLFEELRQTKVIP